MPKDEEDFDAIRRILYLVELGIHADVFSAALNRSDDLDSFRHILGFIEDLLDLGCTISDPE